MSQLTSPVLETSPLDLKQISPRDIRILQQWKYQGLSLMEVKISQVSPVRNQLATNIPLPPNTRISCIIRDGQPILETHNTFIQEQDTLYILTDNESAVREQFIL